MITIIKLTRNNTSNSQNHNNHNHNNHKIKPPSRSGARRGATRPLAVCSGGSQPEGADSSSPQISAICVGNVTGFRCYFW